MKHAEDAGMFKETVTHIVDANMLAAASLRQKVATDAEKLNAEDLACICYTSGTTGLGKGTETREVKDGLNESLCFK